jgi:hypothetical protein
MEKRHLLEFEWAVIKSKATVVVFFAILAGPMLRY